MDPKDRTLFVDMSAYANDVERANKKRWFLNGRFSCQPASDSGRKTAG
jgi:hypothetical protein